MKGALITWGALLVWAGAAAPVRADDVGVTDADRTYRSFTREAATVGAERVRVEVRGLRVEDDENTRLDILGFPVDPTETARGTEVNHVNGGILDLLGSVGLSANSEVGVDVPFVIEETGLEDAPVPVKDLTEESIGDVLFYGKLKHPVAEHCAMGAGVELTIPTGSESERLGTGEFSVNPFVSSRYQRGPFGFGLHAGYQMYTGNYDDIFNYSVQAFARPGRTYAIRAELVGRWFKVGNTRYHDVVVLPGIEFNLSDRFTIRPTGLANVTDEAMDWGLGLGLAFLL
jgi:hypothetical protein